MISKVMEFIELIYEKINWALLGPNIHDIFYTCLIFD